MAHGLAATIRGLSAEFLDAAVQQAASLRETAHRPWPVPDRPWRMGQTWEDLLFAHWAVDPDDVRALVPPGLEVDVRDGAAWVGVTPFRITGLRLRGLTPLPGISRFLELNVRTYVTAEDKPGIWFFSLDTESRLAVRAARSVYRLPYHHASMSAEWRGSWIGYESARRGGERPFVLSARYRGAGGLAGPARPGSVEHFLVERYCLYALDRGRIRRAEIHHGPWSIRPAEIEIDLNTMAPDPLGLPGEPALVHLAARQDVVLWGLERPAALPVS